MRVGVEVGGTFTDLVAVRDGRVVIAKVPSTPTQPDRGALQAIHSADIPIAEITDLAHGSTVATNAVLERKGGRIGAFVSAGTRDLFHLQRQDRTSIYDLNYCKPAPVVARHDICEVAERMAADGSVIQPLDSATLTATVRQFLASATFDAIAICLLHSYANPAHEQQLAAAIRQLAPAMPISCSHAISAEFREYERASTTALAAYVQPVIAGYLERFEHQLEHDGFSGNFSIMQSNGGRMPVQGMVQNAIASLFSGPAAGVVGAMRSAAQSGYHNLVTLDMGGTSTDVALINNGKPTLSPQTSIDGLPVRTPVMDIATVGAGGGSIAWLDDGGLLRVGPQSAGAQPGPACYARGGCLPTVTDAHLARGTLQTESFLGGTMAVDRQAAIQSLSALAEQLKLSIEQLADSAIRVAESNIVRAIQQVTTERGMDPRDFILVPFGGAGPLHAARVAEELAIDTILVPLNAGVLSAAGLLMSDYVHYRSRTRRTRLNHEALAIVRETLGELRTAATDYLKTLGIDGAVNCEYLLEMRYVGQAFELSVGLPDDLDSLTFTSLFDAFREAHQRVFEFSKSPNDPAEIVSYRVGIHRSSANYPFSSDTSRDTAGRQTSLTMTENGQSVACRVLARVDINPHFSSGPLLIEDGTSTIYVPAGWQARCDRVGNLIIERVKP